MTDGFQQTDRISCRVALRFDEPKEKMSASGIAQRHEPGVLLEVWAEAATQRGETLDKEAVGRRQ